MTEYKALDNSDKQKIYVLTEFPYPSGSGLHIGHAFTYTGGDIYARFQRMQGKNVLFTIGWDAFGLPTENYAIRTKQNPHDVTLSNTSNFREQMKSLGYSFDWDREVNTSDPDYYKWTQWIFIKLFERGLAYKVEMPINWCPSCKVGLANEEVINGKCERCGTSTTRRRISQWVVRITEYADRLITGLNDTNFIEKIKTAQINWIGRSEGANIRFKVTGTDEILEVFTTRPDTLWGCTFLVIAPEHNLVSRIIKQKKIADFIENSRKKSDLERTEDSLHKDGIFTGLTAHHPATDQEIPIWISDFVLPTYGTGAIMAVPAHDERDYQFARQYGLPIKPVIKPDIAWDFNEAAYSGFEGKLMESGPLDGLNVQAAIQVSIDWLSSKQLGTRAVSYHLRDWIFSRQHYWGEPIPMIYCEKCGWNPVPEDQLPVILPDVKSYEPTDTGESPLANIAEWVNVKCPKCEGPGRRETDTMPNWAGSDWYFLRYCDPHNKNSLADINKLRYWMPVDVYIGGDEHNTLHLLYSRFIYLFLHDIGAVPPEYPEPYIKRFSHGVILGTDGQRMSKSRGNVIVLKDYVDKYGADTIRMYLMFLGPFDATMAWNERALLGVKRFLDRFTRFVKDKANKNEESGPQIKSIINKLGKLVAEDTEIFKYNTAISHMMETLNSINDLLERSTDQVEVISNQELRLFTQILAPYAPFTAESCWQVLGNENSIHNSSWPDYDPNLIQKELETISIQINGKLRGTINVDPGSSEQEIRQMAESKPEILKYLIKEKIKKVIYIPGRTMNFVTESIN